jgi:hypothetical protein
MEPGDAYRIKAAELLAEARGETNPLIRIEFENLGRGYIRLAQQADRNAKTDITYETPPNRPTIQQQQQQQQPSKSNDPDADKS